MSQQGLGALSVRPLPELAWTERSFGLKGGRRLRPRLYRAHNPLPTRAAALEMEKDLVAPSRYENEDERIGSSRLHEPWRNASMKRRFSSVSALVSSTISSRRHRRYPTPIIDSIDTLGLPHSDGPIPCPNVSSTRGPGR